MEEIRHKGCFHKSVAYCKGSRCPCGGPFKSQRADVADRDEWVEECGDKKKWEEDVGDKDERELRGRENICITNPVCCYAAGGKSSREAKPLFTIICVRLRRQHLNQVLIDNLLILSLRIPGLLWHMPLLLKPAQYLAKTPYRGPKLVKDDVLGKLVLLRLRFSGHRTGTLTLNSRTILVRQNQQQGTCEEILATLD